MHMQWMHITIMCVVHVCGKQLLLQINKNLRYILPHLILSSGHRSWPSLSIQKVYSNYQNYGKCIRN